MESKNERTKIAFSLAAIILIMVVSYIVFPSKRRDFAPQERNEPAQDVMQISPDLNFMDFSKSEPQEIIENADNLNYAVQASYPKLSGEGESIDAANKAIISHAEKIIEEFRGAAKENKITKDAKHALYIEYYFNLLEKDVLSLRFSVSEYFSGAAHPVNYISVINYDIAKRKEIELRDIFLPESDYLTFISVLSTTKLLKEFNDDVSLADWIKTGASPTEENYKNFGFTKENLIIYFNPYQVGPYAAGVREIEISYQELKDKLRPDSFIAKL